MANSRGQRVLYAAPVSAATCSYGMQDLRQAFSSNFLNGFVLEPMTDRPEAYDRGELEQPLSFYLDGVSGVGERHLSINTQTSQNLSPSAQLQLDIATKPSPHATSTSASTEYTASEFESPPSKKINGQGDPHTAENNLHMDTSTDAEVDAMALKAYHGVMTSSKNLDQSSSKTLDSKTIRRLAQNREAARKSRLRKKAYVQQLESSRMKLNQLEQDLQRAQQQGMFASTCLNSQHRGGSGINGSINTGAAAFDMEYANWLDEQCRQMCDLRAALQSHLEGNDLHNLVDSCMAHYDEIFRLKSIAVKADVFHLFSGMWKTPVERCFLWMGGFRPSEILKILIPQIEPVTEQQLLGIYSLQQSSQQAEDALSQGMESLQQTLSETLASGSLSSPDGNMASYMGQMAIAMGKLRTLESFILQSNSRPITFVSKHFDKCIAF